METPISPYPWKLQHLDFDLGQISGPLELHDSDGKLIGIITDPADARLIRHAPELLEAICAITAAFHTADCADMVYGNMPTESWEVYDSLKEQLRTLISSVTGLYDWPEGNWGNVDLSLSETEQ